MPELPEVETVRRSLIPAVIGKPITKVDIFYDRILQKMGREEFATKIVGRQFTNISRRGKYLVFSLEDDLEMVAHLRMTGRLIYVSDPNIPLEKHTSVVFHFGKEGVLRFEDVRKFATINLVVKGDYDEIKGLKTLGIEPLSGDFTLEYFQELVTDRTAMIKGVLLDQTKIAGIGNIYADESLFMAGIHPERPANSLVFQELEKLHGAIKEVLTTAIANQGTTLRDYRTGYGLEGSFQNKLLIYGKKGEKCPRCGFDLEHKKVVGRTSHFCPNCQRE